MLKGVLLIVGLAVAVALTAPGLLQNLSGANNSAAVARTENPAQSQADHGGMVRLSAGRGGHYEADMEVNGRRIGAMVDTGATLVILRYEDARSLGLIFPGDKFDAQVRTANGVARAKRVELRSVRVGPITIRDVDALVMDQGLLGTNLLGMSFLKRLSRYEVQRGQLVLER